MTNCKTAGIIVEFNPFHNGHAEHIKETKSICGAEKIVAVTSGNFVQRGEPALCDKWRRTKMALTGGVDIVLELPVPFVVAGADFFARGAVGILERLGVVDALSFGSECGDIGAIKAAGAVLAREPDLYKNILREELAKGASFAAAQGAGLQACLEATPDGLLTKPNNGLAMEYCKALDLLGSSMEVFTTHRVSGGPSATKMRQIFRDGGDISGFVTADNLRILNEAREMGGIAALDDFSEVFKYLLYATEISLPEGLENRFRRVCGELPRGAKISDILKEVKTKRYTYTRLQRSVMGIVLGVGAADCTGVHYVRVLGFRKDSEGLLAEIVKKASLPVIVNGAKLPEGLSAPAMAMWEKELKAGDIYRNATNNPCRYRHERGVGVIVV